MKIEKYNKYDSLTSWHKIDLDELTCRLNWSLFFCIITFLIFTYIFLSPEINVTQVLLNGPNNKKEVMLAFNQKEN